MAKDYYRENLGEIINNDTEKTVVNKVRYMDSSFIKLESHYLTIKKTANSAQYKNTGRYINIPLKSINPLIKILEEAKTKVEEDICSKKSQTKDVTPKIKQVLKDNIRDKKKAESLKYDVIISFVAERFNCSIKSIQAKKVEKEYLLAKQITIYLVKKMTILRDSEIAKLCGKDSTPQIIHSFNAIQEKINEDDAFEELIAGYIEELFKKKQISND